MTSQFSHTISFAIIFLQDYIGFKTEFERREPVYKKIGEKILSGQALKLTKNDWDKLDTRWREVDSQTRKWLLKLDASLPGRLGKFGEWLYHAELLLLQEADLLVDPDKNHQAIIQILQKHKVVLFCSGCLVRFTYSKSDLVTYVDKNE